MNSKVCVVDDDSAVRQSVADLLDSEGITTECFDSVESFLESVLDSQEPCGCIIADQRMPGMSGVDLKRVLIEKQIETPVILLTGYRDVAIDTEAKSLGIFAILEKPYPPADLIAITEKALDEVVNRFA